MQKLLKREIKAEFIPNQDFVQNFDSDIINQDPTESVVPKEVLSVIKKEEDQFKSFGFNAGE